MAILDRFQSVGASVGRRYRGVKRTVVGGATSLTGFAPFVPQHLTIAPQDLRLPDVALGEQFYKGRYLLAGKLIETEGRSPFQLETDQIAWARALHGFTWLRHFSAGNDPLATNHVIALMREWTESSGGQMKDVAWEVDVTATRLISWLKNSVLMLTASDHEFHQLLMRNLGAHVRFLKRHVSAAGDGEPALMACIALAYASVCFSGNGKSLNFALGRLEQELSKQVLSDGSHVSRNPTVNANALEQLLPLREGCIAIGREVPDGIVSAIERLLQGLRFFRLGDGHFARFNGAGAGNMGLLSTLQRYDEAPTEGPLNTTIGYYERLQLDDVIVLMDAGAPPKGELSRHAHAGCLSFEFSCGGDCVVVNAGRPYHQPNASPAVWRSTAAHSTAVFYETSSCKFESVGATPNLLDGQIFGGQLRAESEREDNNHGSGITAHHMGYVREFGARHQRSLTLDEDGNRLRGSDLFSGPDKGELFYTTKDAVTIHFHLHPTVDVVEISEAGAVHMTTRSGKSWVFSCHEVRPQLADSIYFASHAGPQKTKQIILQFNACNTAEVNWMFVRKQA